MEIKHKILAFILISATVTAIVCPIVMNIFYIPDKTDVRQADMEKMSVKQLDEDLDKGLVSEVYVPNSGTDVYVKLNDGTYYRTQSPGSTDFKYDIMKKGAFVSDISELNSAENVEKKRKGTRNLTVFVSITVAIVCFLLLYKDYMNGLNVAFFTKFKAPAVAGGDQGNGETGFFRKKQEETPETAAKKFSDVAGLHEVKRDVACLVDFLTDKDKYIEAGAVLPKGVILYGPPGTGKTLLAKAIAGEAGVPFLYASGSDFIEMYVGVGAKRIRELFAKARKQSPCIVFIDEIDAIGGKRSGMDNSEDRKAINALLTEMDGFNELDNVVVIGATNRMEDLDPALLRPGRFSDKFCVPLPENAKERLEVIDIYATNKDFAPDFSMEALAKETVGFSPAQIESLLNEAAIIQVQEDRPYIDKDIIDKAMYKVLLNGHEKKDAERNTEELEVVAWHEAGHALIGSLFGKEITKVTIVQSTSGAGGVTFSTPSKTRLLSKDDIAHEVMELYAGRIGELMYYDGDRSKITTGASNDIERATSILYDYVTKYGMSEEFGMVNLEVCGADKGMQLKAVSDMAKDIEDRTEEMVKEHSEQLRELAGMLIENETINSKDVNNVMKIIGKRY